MIITESGTYARLKPDQTFDKWVDREVGDKVRDGFYLPQVIATQPTFDPDIEKLGEDTPIIDLVANTATKTWVAIALDLDKTGNPSGFLAEFFDTQHTNRKRIGDLLLDQIALNPVLGFRLFPSSVFRLRAPVNDNGFYKGLIGLADAASLNAQDRATVNAQLKAYKLRRVL